MRRRFLIPLILLAACGREDEAATAEAPERVEPVVVYATYEDREYLPMFFGEFTKETGVPVTVRHGDLEVIMQDVLESRVDPYADVVIVPSVVDAWRLSEEGALRPMQLELPRVPAALRDPDGYWAAIGGDYPVVISAKSNDIGFSVSEFTELADPKFAGKLCLPSSGHRISQNLIAELVFRDGPRPAELVVRGWVANLAQPVYADQRELVEALIAGKCQIAIASLSTIASFQDAVPIMQIVIHPTPVTPMGIDIEAIGVNRHAENPDGGRQLIKWLAGGNRDMEFSMHTGRQAPDWFSDMTIVVSQSRLAQLNEDAVKLAERARYR
ncbi:MAG: hypothetical protein AAF351_03425 [Pseudomonadota bacterium]